MQKQYFLKTDLKGRTLELEIGYWLGILKKHHHIPPISLFDPNFFLEIPLALGNILYIRNKKPVTI